MIFVFVSFLAHAVSRIFGKCNKVELQKKKKLFMSECSPSDEEHFIFSLLADVSTLATTSGKTNTAVVTVPALLKDVSRGTTLRVSVSALQKKLSGGTIVTVNVPAPLKNLD